MKRPHSLHFVTPFLLAAALVTSCQSTREVVGTETHWLKSCSTDSQCGELECHCQICTLPCSSNATCDSLGGVCSPEGDARTTEQCGGDGDAPTTGLCLAAMGAATGSPGGEGGTGTATGNGEAGGTTTGSSGSGQGGANGGEGGTLASSGMTNGGAPPAEAGAPAQGGNSSSGAGGQGTSTCDELDRTDLGGCCYDDTDCADGQRCYGASCSVDAPVPGRCAAALDGGCYDDQDCAETEYCDGGTLAQCGSLAPDALGTCAEDCDFDSCHPERCDELGESCCDPFPGDGVNYCNDGLECRQLACVDPDAPEEETLCWSSGGTWEPGSCGHYSCGRPPSCEALIPGCNCGIDRTFGESGCEVDATCDVASTPFECGQATCESVGTQYCFEDDAGAAGTLARSCEDIPDACTDENPASPCNCARLLQAVGGDSCRTGFDGELIVYRLAP